MPVVILAMIGDVRLLQAARDRRRAEGRRRRRDDDHGRRASVLLAVHAIRTAPSRSNTMVAPADQVVNERVKGLDWDVIHSWWVPDFGGKYDAIPGKVNKTWFEAPAGDYVARCAELCGIQHAAMNGDGATSCRVRSTTRSSPSDARTRPGAELGQEEWPACQSVPPARPRLHRAGARRQPAARRPERTETLLRNGQGQMPAVGSELDRRTRSTRSSRTRSGSPKGGGSRWPSTSRASSRIAPTGAAAA